MGNKIPKVRIIGLEDRKQTSTIPPRNTETKKKEHDTNMENKSIDPATLFTGIRNSLKKKAITIDEAVALINLNIKSMYIDCIGNAHLDTETNQYLDEILFNHINGLIKFIISESDTDKIQEYEDIIISSIQSTTRMLDYNDEFDFLRMFWLLHEFVKVFS